MIETINLLWIIPLSAMAGGFLLTVLLIHGVLAEKGKKKNDDE